VDQVGPADLNSDFRHQIGDAEAFAGGDIQCAGDGRVQQCDKSIGDIGCVQKIAHLSAVRTAGFLAAQQCADGGSHQSLGLFIRPIG
jgi:hypothetical protein